MLGLSSIAAADVKSGIEAVLRDPYLKNVRVGIKIVKLGDKAPGDTIYELEPTKPLTPASNLKLVTTAAALDTLGPDFQFRTRLLKNGNTLALVGDGDPSLGDSEALSKAGWKSTTLFEKWGEALIAAGVKSADKLVYDDSIFDGPFVHPSWPPDQLNERYVAGVAGLNFNANCIGVSLTPRGNGVVADVATDPPTSYVTVVNTCVGSSRNAVRLGWIDGTTKLQVRGTIDAPNGVPFWCTIADPPAYTATVLRDVLVKAGVTITGEVTRDPTVRQHAADWQPLAVYETPIAQVVARANKDSMNLYAEALAKRTGAAKGGVGNWKTSAEAIGAFLQSIGVPADQFSLDDGCGLSRKNVVSPNVLVSVLEREFYGPGREPYLASLSIAGVDGTLKDRFAGTKLRERVIGKSGFINGVSALAGFVKAKDGSTYIFSILFNGIAEKSNSHAKTIQEKIVQTLDE